MWDAHTAVVKTIAMRMQYVNKIISYLGIKRSNGNSKYQFSEFLNIILITIYHLLNLLSILNCLIIVHFQNISSTVKRQIKIRTLTQFLTLKLVL